MKKNFWVILVVVFIIAVGYFLVRSNYQSSPNTESITQPTLQPTSQITFTPENTQHITIQNSSFNPAEITVKVGTTVVWTNQDSAQHDITSDSGLVLKSQLLKKGESFSYGFSKEGEYFYHCSIHPNMQGKIMVIP